MDHPVESLAPLAQPLCALHPGVLAEGACARCGDYACRSCLNDGLCKRCDHTRKLPFAERRERGFFSAYFATLKLAFLRPEAFARGVSGSQSTAESMLFGAFSVGVSLLILSTFTGLILAATIKLGAGDPGASKDGLGMWVVPLLVAGYLFGGLFVFALGSIAWAGILRLAMIVCSIPLNFAANMRIAMYSTAPMALAWIPLAGIGAWVYSFVLQVYGVQATGRTNGGRAALAVLVPAGMVVVSFTTAYALWIVYFIQHMPRAT